MRNARSTIAALALGILMGLGAVQLYAAIPPIRTATDPSQAIPAVIAQVNAYLGNLVSLSNNTGELAFSATQSWTANSNVATTMTSLGPQGSHTTVQKWLVVVDNTGTVVYIPAY